MESLEKIFAILQGSEGKENCTIEMLTDFRQRRKDSSDRLYCFGENGEESISEDYLQKCWSQIKENKLLKIQFATWYKMTAPLVFYATERGKGKGDNGSNKEGSDDDT